MSIRCCFKVTLGHFKSSQLTFGRHLTKSKTGLFASCLQNNISCEVVLKPSLRHSFGTSSRTDYKSFGQIFRRSLKDSLNDFLKNRSNAWQFRQRYDKAIQESAIPKRMEGILWQIGSLFRFTPTRFMGLSVSTSVLYLSYFYHWNHVALPLNGRKAFIIQTDQEAMDRSRMMSQVIIDIAGPVTRLDDTGAPTDSQTQRMELIMKRLRDNNPELDRHLPAGAQWTPLVVPRNENIDYRIAIAYLCGVVLLAGDIMDDLDDDMLGFLLAHEMTHVIQRHENERFGNNIFFYHFFRRVLKPMKEYIVDFDIKTYISYFAKNLNFVNPKTQEMEADEFGFQFASKACWDYRRFGTGLHDMERMQAEKMSFGQILRFLMMANAPEPPDTRGEVWDNEVFAELEKSQFWMDPQFPTMEERVATLQSPEYHAKAEEWRRQKGCPPLLPLTQNMAQKVSGHAVANDVVRNREEMQQRQGESVLENAGDPVFQSQGDQSLQRQENQSIQSPVDQSLQNEIEPELLSQGEPVLHSQGQPVLLNQVESKILNQAESIVQMETPKDTNSVITIASELKSPDATESEICDDTESVSCDNTESMSDRDTESVKCSDTESVSCDDTK